MTLLQTAIKTFDKIKLAEADEKLLIEVREEAEMMQKLCTRSSLPPLPQPKKPLALH